MERAVAAPDDRPDRTVDVVPVHLQDVAPVDQSEAAQVHRCADRRLDRRRIDRVHHVLLPHAPQVSGTPRQFRTTWGRVGDRDARECFSLPVTDGLAMKARPLLGLSLLASVIMTTLISHRLAMHKVGPAAAVPITWIVRGWLGQSITAVNLLGNQAHLAIGAPYAGAFEVLGVLYGVPVLGFTLLWAAIAAALTIRTARARLRFALTWWSFTFPGRHRRHRHQRTRRAYRLGRRRRARRRLVPAPAGRVGHRRRHHARRRHGRLFLA